MPESLQQSNVATSLRDLKKRLKEAGLHDSPGMVNGVLDEDLIWCLLALPHAFGLSDTTNALTLPLSDDRGLPGLTTRVYAPFVEGYQSSLPPDPEQYIRLGRRSQSGAGSWFSYALSELTKHVMVVGATGSGKSSVTQFLIRELARIRQLQVTRKRAQDNSISYLILEPVKTEYYDSLIHESHIAESQAVSPFDLRLFHFQGNSRGCGEFVAFDPMRIPPGTMVSKHASFLVSCFTAAFPMDPYVARTLETGIMSYYTSAWAAGGCSFDKFQIATETTTEVREYQLSYRPEEHEEWVALLEDGIGSPIPTSDLLKILEKKGPLHVRPIFRSAAWWQRIGTVELFDWIEVKGDDKRYSLSDIAQMGLDPDAEIRTGPWNWRKVRDIPIICGLHYRCRDVEEQMMSFADLCVTDLDSTAEVRLPNSVEWISVGQIPLLVGTQVRKTDGQILTLSFNELMSAGLSPSDEVWHPMLLAPSIVFETLAAPSPEGPKPVRKGFGKGVYPSFETFMHFFLTTFMNSSVSGGEIGQKAASRSSESLYEWRMHFTRLFENLSISLIGNACTHADDLARQNKPAGLNPIGHILEKPAVLELDAIADSEQKALFMSFLLVTLFEVRQGEDLQRRKNGFTGPVDLKHVFILEEAHRILSQAGAGRSEKAGDDPRSKAVSMFVDLLAEIRAFGQGLVVVEQIPTKIASEAIKNTQLKIILKLPAPDDQDHIGDTIGLNKRQKSFSQQLGIEDGAVQLITYDESLHQPIILSLPLRK